MTAKTLRRAQTLSPFGVGAIMEIDGESLVAADSTYWKSSGEEIHEPRLEKYLAVRKFMMAEPESEISTQSANSTHGVPFVRFPVWHFCTYCRHMYKVINSVQAPTCRCGKDIKLTPMRFVMACPNGHLADVPWDIWAHSTNRSSRCEKPNLVFITEAGGGGLEFVFVECLTCKSRRSLAGIAAQDSMKQLNIHCPGHHPWTPWEERETGCEAIPQVLQRGASNLTFPLIESSIDIPPHSNWNAYSSDTRTITNDDLFIVIKNAFYGHNMDTFERALEMLAKKLHREPDFVRNTVMQELNEENADISTAQWNPDDLLAEEFTALSSPMTEYDQRDRFIKKDVSLVPFLESCSPSDYQSTVSELCSKIGLVVQVVRLREVRALRGFSRLGPVESMAASDDGQAGHFSVYNSDRKIPPVFVPADLNSLPHDNKWLPAIEVFGEGIFITLDESSLQDWEKNDSVAGRVERLKHRRSQNAFYLPDPTPRLVLLHTLSHILIRQLSFECGYSIASLRERIYSRAPSDSQESAAGILIYTAAGDSEGTLGGLVRQGEASRIVPVILRALQSSVWCSSDPLCRESQGQGLYAMNLAACHACSLLPEVSCTLSNRLLDRILLVGSLDGSVKGYFSELMKHFGGF